MLGGDNGSTPRELRFVYWWGGHLKKARETLDHVLIDWSPEKLIIAHGKCESSDAVAVIDRCLQWIPKKEEKPTEELSLLSLLKSKVCTKCTRTDLSLLAQTSR